MALDYLGAELTTGAAPGAGTWTDYVVQRATINGKEVDFEDVFDAAGALATRIIFRRHDVLEVEAVLKSTAAPSTDFPPGDMCALADLTLWYVESAPVSKVKGANTVNVRLINLGIT